jgi:hypothetical protein
LADVALRVAINLCPAPILVSSEPPDLHDYLVDISTVVLIVQNFDRLQAERMVVTWVKARKDERRSNLASFELLGCWWRVSHQPSAQAKCEAPTLRLMYKTPATFAYFADSTVGMQSSFLITRQALLVCE